MTATRQEIVEAIKQMTVLEAAELVTVIENTFGITATPVPTAIINSDSSNLIEEEVQTEFSVTIHDLEGRKVPIVQVIRKINSSLGLKEAKYLIDDIEKGTPYVVKESVSAEEAHELSTKLEAVGAVVVIK